MLTIYIAFTALALCVAVLLYASHAHAVIKATALASLIVLGLGLESHYRDRLGAPIEGYPQGGFTYVHHVIYGNSIMLWVNTEGLGSRLYVFPYDQETAEELEEAKEGNDQGFERTGAFVVDPRNTEAMSLEMDDINNPQHRDTKG